MSQNLRWTRAEYERHLLKQANRKTGGASSSAKLKPVVCDESVGKKEGKGGNPDRIHVRIISFRRKLCDPDNLCPKYFIDCLRYSEIIANDRPEDITLEVSQEKVKNKADERTEIEIIYNNAANEPN